MILEVIIEFIVDKNRSRHGGGYFESESAVGDCTDGTVAVVLDAHFLDGVGENQHGNADADEDDGHDEEESDRFGERWDRQPRSQHLLLERLEIGQFFLVAIVAVALVLAL
jgi:hypothetical protein